MDSATDNAGGQGEGPLPSSDGHHDRADAKLVARAVRRRWPIPDQLKADTVERLARIVRESDDDRAVGNAVRALKDMEGQNQADEHHADKQRMVDQTPADQRSVTINIL